MLEESAICGITSRRPSRSVAEATDANSGGASEDGTVGWETMVCGVIAMETPPVQRGASGLGCRRRMCGR
ncbi:Hypothetical protein A7982_00769 [Minicystis rosea]|nr:Hypothetical protein A7982_00769 [Minicystis rosea]